MVLQSLMNASNIADSTAIAICFVRANPDAIEGSDVSQIVLELVKKHHDPKAYELVPQNSFVLMMRAKRAEDREVAHSLLWRAFGEIKEKTFEKTLAIRIGAIASFNRYNPLVSYGDMVINALRAYVAGEKLKAFVVPGATKFIEIAGARDKIARKRAPKPIEMGREMEIENWENDENIFIMDDV